MAAFTTIAMVAGLAVGAVGTYASIQQSKEARREQQKAAKTQQQIRAEQAAGNERERAIAERQRIREERVRRAQVIAASENTGTAATSSAMGALGGMGTQFGAASGSSMGMFQQGQRISGLSQLAADYTTNANNHMSRSGFYGQIASMGSSIFSFGYGQYQQNQAAQARALRGG